MIRLEKTTITIMLIFFIGDGIIYDFNTSWKLAISIGGMYLYIVNVIYAYIRLKSVGFIFKKAATNKEWVLFLFDVLIAWILFLIFLPSWLIFYISCMSHSILVILFFYDVLKKILRR